jgi:hypothetical protein
MSAPMMTITIAPNAVWVSFHDADGAPMGPPREISVDLDRRLATRVATLQAFARRELAALESAAERRAGDGDQAIAAEIAEGKQIG